MKKLMAVILAGLMTGTLMTGCGTPSESSSQAPAGGSSSAPAPAPSKDAEISVISREDGSGTRGAFIELFKVEVKGDDGSKKDMTTKEAIIANKTDVMLTSIASDENAIGYVSLGSLNDSVKALDIDGVKASTDNVKNGTYKISRPFNIATKGDPSHVAQDFIDYILSAEGQAVVAKSYIAVNDGAPAYAGTKPAGKIVVSGSSSVTPIMEKLKEAYAVINPDAVIEIQMTDSTAGMTGAIDGTCDIGMASRGLKDSEKEQLTGTEIALDGIAVVVNTKNPMTGADSEDIRKIFTGEATTWGQLAK